MTQVPVTSQQFAIKTSKYQTIFWSCTCGTCAVHPPVLIFFPYLDHLVQTRVDGGDTSCAFTQTEV